MILAALILLQTLAQIDALPPAAAGDAVLRGKPHRRIVAVVQVNSDALRPPGLIERDLIEAPELVPQGCRRARWRASFHTPAGGGADTTALSDAYAVQEIRLSIRGACSDTGYARVNPGIALADALAALQRLERARRGAALFTCTDTTGSRLCASDATIRRELTRLSPWAIARDNGRIELWLSDAGRAVTAVRFDTDDRAIVTRSFPAPA